MTQSFPQDQATHARLAYERLCHRVAAEAAEKTSVRKDQGACPECGACLTCEARTVNITIHVHGDKTAPAIGDEIAKALRHHGVL